MRSSIAYSSTTDVRKGHASFLSGRKANTAFFSQIQPKLAIGQPGDKYEVEADAMADSVVQKLQRKENNAPPFFKKVSNTIQPKCNVCTEEVVQRKEIEEDIEDTTLEQDLRSSKGTGTALSSDTRSNMETAFDTDFSKVRIHTGSNAVQMSQNLNAQAFTHGSDVYFNRGKYNPNTSMGQHLLAHELTHVVQQNTSNIQTQIQRMEACPGHLEDADPIPEGWRAYGGSTEVFHCGFRTILENRTPTPNDPMNECVYDHSGTLVTENHPYSGCRGTPDQYDGHGGISMPFDTVMHTFCDTGGIVAQGVPAFVTSMRYHITTQIQNSPLDQQKKQLLLIAFNRALGLGQGYLESMMIVWRLMDEVVLTDLAEELLGFIEIIDGFNRNIASLLAHLPMSPEIRRAIALLQLLIQQHLDFLRGEVIRFIRVVEQGGCTS